MSGEVLIKQLQVNLESYKTSYRKLAPYIKIKMGKKIFTTAVDTSGSFCPQWETKFLFRRTKEKEIIIEVWNMKRFFFNTLLGSITIPFSLVYTKQYLYKEHLGWFTLEHKGNPVGRLHLEIVFYPDVIYPNLRFPVFSCGSSCEKLPRASNAWLSSSVILAELDNDLAQETKSSGSYSKSTGFIP